MKSSTAHILYLGRNVIDSSIVSSNSDMQILRNLWNEIVQVKNGKHIGKITKYSK